MQCGHYWSRRYLGTRWDEINCQPQCESCNILHEGNKPKFERNIRLSYGDHVLEALEIKALSITKISDYSLQLLHIEYKEKLKTLRLTLH